MAAFTGVMAKSYAAYRANPAAWTADSPQVRHIVKLIGGKPGGRGRGAGPAGVPDRRRTGLGRLAGRRQAGATRAFNASAQFLKEQKQIDKALGTTAPT